MLLSASKFVPDCLADTVMILFMFFLSCIGYAFVRVCLFVPCGHLLGKG